MKRYCDKCNREPRDQAEHVLMVESGLCNDCYAKEQAKSGKLPKRQWCEEHETFDTCRPDEEGTAEET